MRVSREKAAEHRERIIEAASGLFRAKGFDGIGVADIMKAADLTHGGFYGHFSSKDDLVGQASKRTMARAAEPSLPERAARRCQLAKAQETCGDPSRISPLARRKK